mmetsp:Transcript_16172/g.48565  ORF Transcript_16172/g.48565 Transcript_16172/m.48565 type:complete len:351 (-) Transcript_16172:451-1503(-)
MSAFDASSSAQPSVASAKWPRAMFITTLPPIRTAVVTFSLSKTRWLAHWSWLSTSWMWSLHMTTTVAVLFRRPASASSTSYMSCCRGAKTRMSASRAAYSASEVAATFPGNRSPGMYFGFSRVRLMMSTSFSPSTSSSATQSIMSVSKCDCDSTDCPTRRAMGEPRTQPPKQATLSFFFSGEAAAGRWRETVRDRRRLTRPGGSSRFVGTMKCATALVFPEALPMAQATRTDCSISRSLSVWPKAHVSLSLRPMDRRRVCSPVALFVFGATMSMVVARLCLQDDLPGFMSASTMGLTTAMFVGSQSTRIRLTPAGILGVGESQLPSISRGSGSRTRLCMHMAHSSDLSMT